MEKINGEIDVTHFYFDFLTKGYAVFDGTDILKDVAFRPFLELESKFPTGVFNEDRYEVEFKPTAQDKEQLAVIASLINASQIFTPGDLVKYHFLDYRVNQDVHRWHNDAANCFEQHNATVNCFFDDMSEETGGRFDVMRYRRDIAQTTMDHPDMSSVYPKKFMIIVFNQNRNFMHKVQSTMHLRRMMSFAAGFLNFNQIVGEQE